MWFMVNMVRKILGTSNLTGTYSLKATIIRDVVDELNLKSGDKIVYIEEDGRIYIEKA
jgi:tRNA U38,U39,U40 pseudouridine synthase TruA